MDYLKFYKYHGCGNDFILVEDHNLGFLADYRTKIPSLCQYHFGIGADGILLIQPSKLADIKMRIFNPDGKEAKMCGNGLRCIAKHYGQDCSIETNAGIALAEIHGDLVKASLPNLNLIKEPIPLPMDREGFYVFSGTEHLVVFTDDLQSQEFIDLATMYRHHEMFQPSGVNVNFAKVVGSDLIYFRTFEKGVEGETHSCGTGGAAVAAAHHNLCNEKRVRLISSDKEELVFSFDSNNTLWMIGPAELVFEGNFIPKKSPIH